MIKPAMDLMTQAEYARHRGVTRQAVNKALGAGKIKLRERAGKKGIDPAEADVALGINVQRVIAGDDEGHEIESRREVPRQAPGLTQARTATEVYRARLAELEYNKQLGKLRPLEQTETGAQRCGEVVLRAIDGIVGRAEEINAQAAKEGLVGVRAAMRVIVRDLRNVCSREFVKLAAGEGDDDAAEPATEFEAP